MVFTVCILGASSYETRRANATLLILVFIGLVLRPIILTKAWLIGALIGKWPIRPPINQGEVQSLQSALQAPDTQEEIMRGSPT